MPTVVAPMTPTPQSPADPRNDADAVPLQADDDVVKDDSSQAEGDDKRVRHNKTR